jgi:hypothetical protein
MPYDLLLLDDRLAICKFAPDAPLPAWLPGGFVSVTRTQEELSIVCCEAAIPMDVPCEKTWRVFQIQGPLDFSLTGVLVAVAKPLAEAGVSIFAISTFNTDYVLVRAEDVEQSVAALTPAGHRIAFIGGSVGQKRASRRGTAGLGCGLLRRDSCRRRCLGERRHENDARLIRSGVQQP